MGRSNPDIFGEDVTGLLVTAGGAALTAAGNDKVVAPMIKGIVPGIYGSEFMAKLVDAGTTAGTAFVVGEVVGLIDRRQARRARYGGLIIAAGKALSSVLPGFGLSANLPSNFSLTLPFFNKKELPAPANGASNGNPSIPASTRALGVGSMGL